jgi:actinin alpha
MSAEALQRKIFSRWVSMKLWMSRHIKVTDIVTDLQNDPTILLALIEVLSEKTFTGKIDKSTKMRMQKISATNIILKFVYDDCGVQMKIKTSAEDIADGAEKAVLGLVFQILLKFMKIGDDEGPQLNAKDALLMWIQNKVAGYKDVSVTNFTNSFHSGLALCALIHKHRPNLIQFETLNKENKLDNLKTAMVAAERYFGLEQYITPADILKLDENGMMVYASEYFYGIAEQRKIDQAVRRIHKVIKFTKTCDAMRADYNRQAAEFKERVSKVEKILNDRTIDNTMAGAKHKIEEFYEYKAKDKNVIIELQLTLEALFNNLGVLLTNNKRPPFNPPLGLTPKDLEATVRHLEQVEQERNVALHAELNRQVRLLKQDEHHTIVSNKLTGWVQQKDAYLARDDPIESVGAALLAIRTLEAFDKEMASLVSGTFAALRKNGAHLASEKYERTAQTLGRESALNDSFAHLKKLSQERRPVLDAALAREQRKEELRLQFANLAADVIGWVKETADDLGSTIFGFTLEEVEAFAATMEATNKSLNAEMAKRKAAIDAVTTEMAQLQCHDNPYTEFTVADIEAAVQSLAQAQQGCQESYDAELAKQRANDELCKHFAQVADPLAAWLVETKDKITHSREKLRTQLELVEKLLASKDADTKAISQVVALQKQIEEAQVMNNRHTTLTAKDLEVQIKQYGDFLAKKKAVLIQEIQNEECRGISPQQFQEIEDNFHSFDTDKSGDIDAKEFKACLFSLGEELPLSAVTKIMEEHGNKLKITYEAFKQFMVRLYGDVDTKDAILESWKLVARGEPVVKVAQYEDIMADEDKAYMAQTAPPKDGGYNYIAWTDDVFSR